MADGPITGAYKADRQQVIDVLNEALATEITCVLRYKNHYFMAEGLHGEAVAAEFLEHAEEEQDHADQIAERPLTVSTQSSMLRDLELISAATVSHMPLDAAK